MSPQTFETNRCGEQLIGAEAEVASFIVKHRWFDLVDYLLATQQIWIRL